MRARLHEGVRIEPGRALYGVYEESSEGGGIGTPLVEDRGWRIDLPQSSIFDPRYSTQSFETQPLKRSILFHLFEKAPVDQLLRFDLFGARVGAGDLV